MRQYEATELKDGEYKPERVFTGEVARLKSYKTQRPPFDMKNPYMAGVNVNRNIQVRNFMKFLSKRIHNYKIGN